MSALRVLVAATLFVVLFFLALANAEPVTLHLFRFASAEAPLVLVVLAALALGVALGLAAGAVRNARLRRQLRRMRARHAGPPARAPGPTPDAFPATDARRPVA